MYIFFTYISSKHVENDIHATRSANFYLTNIGSIQCRQNTLQFIWENKVDKHWKDISKELVFCKYLIISMVNLV
jgi:hypothetical protein